MYAQLAASTLTTLLTSCASTTSAVNSQMLQTSSASMTRQTMLPLTLASSVSSPSPPPTIASDTLPSTEAIVPTPALTILCPTAASALSSAFWRRNLLSKDTETTLNASSQSHLILSKFALSMTSQEAVPKSESAIFPTTLRETVSIPVVKILRRSSAD